MKKKLALGIALVGTTLLALSLTVFGMGAAATLNPTAAHSPSALPTESSVAPVAVPAPTASPTATETAATAAPDNADPLTSDNFRAMTPDEQSNAREWMETQTITAACMSAQGYEYTFIPFWEREPGAPMEPSWMSALPLDEQAGARLALDGDTGGGADYHWDDAGCWGYAVHVMGNDSAH